MQGFSPISIVSLVLLLLLFLLLRPRDAGSWVERAVADRRIRWVASGLGALSLCLLLGLALPVSRQLLVVTGMEPLSTGFFAGLVALFSLPIAWRALVIGSTGQSSATLPFLRAHGWQLALLTALSSAYLWLDGAGYQALQALAEDAGDGWLYKGLRIGSVAMMLASFAAMLVVLMTVVPTLRWLGRQIAALVKTTVVPAWRSLSRQIAAVMKPQGSP